MPAIAGPHRLNLQIPAVRSGKFQYSYYDDVMKASHMTIYISLGSLSREAFENMDTIEVRDKKAVKLIESLGGKLIALYYTLGRYDFVAIVDMPSKESLVKFLSILGKFGTIRTETLETIPTDLIYKVAKEI